MEIRVRVKAGSKREGVRTLRDGRLEIAVSEPREAGRANERARELAALHYGIPLSKVRIVKGLRSPGKTFFIEGLKT